MNYITEDDMVFTNDAEKGIYSGGFKVDSIMMKLGISPILTVNKNLEKEKNGSEPKVSDLFSQLVVPNWIAYYPNKKGGEKMADEKETHLDSHDNIDIEGTLSDDDDISIEENEDSIIGGTLYDRLVELATVNEKELKQSKKNKTKRNKVKSAHKKTNKNK
jgi:hypothetical protein